MLISTARKHGRERHITLSIRDAKMPWYAATALQMDARMNGTISTRMTLLLMLAHSGQVWTQMVSWLLLPALVMIANSDQMAKDNAGLS